MRLKSFSAWQLTAGKLPRGQLLIDDSTRRSGVSESQQR